MPETSIRGLKQRIRMRFPSHSLRHRLPHHHGRPSAASQPDFTTEPFVAAEPVPDPPRVPPVSRFPMAHLSEQLKERGNQLFKHGDYVAAEALYTQAIQKNPNNPLLFTNRANARMKLESWELAIDDCLKSIELLRDNLKAYTFLGKCIWGGIKLKSFGFMPARAQLALKHPNEALSSALVAYDLCIRSKTLTKDAQTISALVLQCKKAKWEGRERERLRRKSPLLAELEDKIELASNQELASINERADKGELGEIAASEEREEVAKRTAQKLEDLRNIFAIADPDNMSKKEVPDYLIDNITFEIMHDPVVTKTGHSYERATLIEHLKRSPYDPLTREPLKIEDLRTNILLRDACNDFFEKNSGWVYDW